MLGIRLIVKRAGIRLIVKLIVLDAVSWAMYTPALARIPIAERREAWIVWVLHEVLLGHNSCLPPTSTTHMLEIFDFSLTPTSTTQTQANNAR